MALQKQEQEDSGAVLYEILDDYVSQSVIKSGNTRKSWKYGYDAKHDMVIVSKTGEIGDIYKIQNLVIALPKAYKNVWSRSNVKEHQYWERQPLPEELSRIKTLKQWRSKPKEFKSKWISYIDQEFERRDFGLFIMSNGNKVWIPPSQYQYLQWSNIDIGYPDFREANRILYIFWEACIADHRCYGLNYLKIRRSGFSFMSSSELINIGTRVEKSHLGILSKTGADAKEMFTGKVVPINNGLPFFFKPFMAGMDTPKSEISYTIPATKITKKNMDGDESTDDAKGLDTFISWRNTDNNSYDSMKLRMLIHDEAYKWTKPNNIKKNWRVTKTCLRLGKNIVGKCMMGSTCNALKEGGQEGKEIYYDSDIARRSANGQTKSGLYSLFIPMEWNMEGFIDRYGMPVIRTPDEPVLGIDGEMIDQGAIDYWEGEVESLKGDPDALNEFYRQYPRNEGHAFRDDSKNTLFNLTNLYEQIDYNDSFLEQHLYTRGGFRWKDGIKFGNVEWYPDVRGRFLVSWTPPKGMENRWIERNGMKYPANEHLGCFGLDGYDISGVVGGGGSKGAAHGFLGSHMDDAPTNQFFLEYIARPPMAEIFFEDILMAIIFYGMPILAENNKPRFLYFLKNNGFRKYSLTRPDKPQNKLTSTERELGGIPSSDQVIGDHTAAIETYIQKHVGVDHTGSYRDKGDMGTMPFNRTLSDWVSYNPKNRTVHDPTVSSGFAIIGANRHLYNPVVKESKISFNFATYDNNGLHSSINNGKR